MAQYVEELHTDISQEIPEAQATHETADQPVEHDQPHVPEVITPEDVKSPEDSAGSEVSPAAPAPVETPEPITENEEHSSADPFAEKKGIGNYGWLIMLVVIFIAVFGIIFFLLTRGASKTKVSITYWGLWEDAAVYQPLITEYQKLHPEVIIKYEKQSPKDYKDKLIVRGKEGTGPDIFRYHNTWVPMLTDILSEAPKDVMSEQEFTSTFYPVAQQDLVIKVGTRKKVVGIPLEIDGLVLLYNTNSFQKVGLTTPPRTWDDIIKYAQQLTVPDQAGTANITSGIALGTAENIEHFSDILGWLLLQNGTSITQLSSSEAAKALELYREFAESPLKVWDESMPNSINAFAQGKVAMIFAPSWQVHTIRALNPDLQFKAAVLPILPGETNPLSIASYWAEGVSTGSKHQKEAWAFLKYLSSKEAMMKLYSEESKFRLFGEPYSRRDLSSQLEAHDFLGPVIAQAPYMQTQPTISNTADNGLNDEIIVYLKNAVNQTEEGVSYTQAFSTAATGVDQIFQKYHITK